MNPEEFKQALEAKGIMLSEAQEQQFKTYFEFLVETNQHLNLTAITEEKEVYLKHFYDSLTPAFYDDKLRNEPLTICDIGAGAGFPSIPLKIVFPQLKVTIVDSLNKRITFLNDLAQLLKLKECHFVHARAEEVGRQVQYREQFDLVMARAVARMSVLAEFCLPLVKMDGDFLALKAASTPDELADAAFAIETLGGRLVEDCEFQLPEAAGERHLVFINKIKATPKKYPRKPGTPLKQPLQTKKIEKRIQ